MAQSQNVPLVGTSTVYRAESNIQHVFSFILTVSVQLSIQLYLYSINNNSLLCRAQCLMQGEPLLTEVNLEQTRALAGKLFHNQNHDKEDRKQNQQDEILILKNMIKSQSLPYLRVTVPQNKWTDMQ